MDVVGSANPSAPSSSSNEISVQEETLMKYFSGLIQASFGSVQSAKRTNGQIKVHWRVSVRSSCEDLTVRLERL